MRILLFLAVLVLVGCEDDRKAPPRHEASKPVAVADTKLQVTGLSPQLGVEGDRVVVEGTNFEGVVKIYFGDHAGTVVSVDRERIVVEVPEGEPARTVNVLLAFEQGGDLMLPSGFSYR